MRPSNANISHLMGQSMSMTKPSSNSNFRKVRTKSSEEIDVRDRRFSSTANKMKIFIKQQDDQANAVSASGNARSVSLGLLRPKDNAFQNGFCKSTESLNAITPNAKTNLIPSSNDEKQKAAAWNGSTGSVSETKDSKDSKSGGHRSTNSGGTTVSPVMRRESSSTSRAVNTRRVASMDSSSLQHPLDVAVSV